MRIKKAGAGDFRSSAPQTQNAACLMCRMIERSVFGYVADTSAYSVMEGWLHAWPGTPLEMAKWPNAVCIIQHNFRYVVLCLLRRTPQSSLYYIACQNSNTLCQIKPSLSAFMRRFQTGRGNFPTGLCVHPFYLSAKRQAVSKRSQRSA